MIELKFEGMKDLHVQFAHTLRRLPGKRQEMHENIAKRLEKHVRQNVYMSGINSTKVEGWQVGRVGTRGGYAAVSPISGPGGKNSPGAITGYLERGHGVRKPGKTKPRAKKAFVAGFHFYRYSKMSAAAVALDEAEKTAYELACMLKGESK